MCLGKAAIWSTIGVDNGPHFLIPCSYDDENNEQPRANRQCTTTNSCSMYWPSNAHGVGSMSIGIKTQNQLIGTHIATVYPIEITLNAKEMQLATVKGPYINRCWEYMCESLESRGEAGRDLIEGNIEIDYIVIEGELNVFH